MELGAPSGAWRLLASTQSLFQVQFRMVMGLSRRRIELLPGARGLRLLLSLALSLRVGAVASEGGLERPSGAWRLLLPGQRLFPIQFRVEVG